MNTKRYLFKGICIVVACVVIWLIGVQRRSAFGKCAQCNYGYHLVETRVFGLCVKAKKTEDHSVVEFLAIDLGVGCSHSSLTEVTAARLAGGIWPVGEVIGGTWFMGLGPDWYNAATSERVRKMVEEDPSLPGRFHEEVLERNNRQMVKDIVAKIRPEEAK